VLAWAIGISLHCRKTANSEENKVFSLRSVLKGKLCGC